MEVSKLPLDALTIIHDLMSRSKDSQKRKLAFRLECACLFTVHIIRSQSLPRKACLSRELDCLGRRLTTVPVAQPVRVTGPDENRQSPIHQIVEERNIAAGI